MITFSVYLTRLIVANVTNVLYEIPSVHCNTVLSISVNWANLKKKLIPCPMVDKSSKPVLESAEVSFFSHSLLPFFT